MNYTSPIPEGGLGGSSTLITENLLMGVVDDVYAEIQWIQTVRWVRDEGEGLAPMKTVTMW